MRTRFCVSDSYKDSTQSGFLISTKVITQKTLMGTLSLKTHGAQAAITLGCTSCFGFNRTFGIRLDRVMISPSMMNHGVLKLK